MNFSIDLWFGEWGFGFTIWIWERFKNIEGVDPSEIIYLGFDAQIKGFGKSRTCNRHISNPLTSKPSFFGVIT